MWPFSFKKLTVKISTLSISALLLSACASQPETTPITLHIFDCGEIEVRDVSLFSPGVDEGITKQMVDSCYLIQHPKGSLIWDTGLSDAIGPNGIEKWKGAFFMSVPKTFASQLSEIGIDPKQVDYLAMSHFHSDHVGNANLFSNAKLVIQKEEHDAAFSENADKFGFDASLYEQVNREKIDVIEGDKDLFGDGSVVIKRAIGHTPGHQVLFVNLAQTGPVVLSGDLYHFTKNRTHKRVPSFNFNKEQTLSAMNEIENFVKDKKAQLWIQHDKEQNQTLKHSPEYYQ
ncbi:MAG: N-acyl homoserine lactonase family protein [Bermanella sp.]